MKRFFMIMCFILTLCSGYAKTINDITLVVSSTSATKEQAIQNALRSAIELAYGTFISSYSKVENDKLIKDEIVSISSGNIKSYEILSEQNRGAFVSVSIKATVSVSKLLNYAKSHGLECEFDGQSLANNVRIMKLRSENTTKALEHLLDKIRISTPDAFDYKISIVGNPKLVRPRYSNEQSYYEFESVISCYANAVSSQIQWAIYSTLEALELPWSEVSNFESFVGISTFSFGDGYAFNKFGSENLCRVPDSSKKFTLPGDQTQIIEEIKSAMRQLEKGIQVCKQGKGWTDYEQVSFNNSKNNEYLSPGNFYDWGPSTFHIERLNILGNGEAYDKLKKNRNPGKNRLVFQIYSTFTVRESLMDTFKEVKITKLENLY